MVATRAPLAQPDGDQDRGDRQKHERLDDRSPEPPMSD